MVFTSIKFHLHVTLKLKYSCVPFMTMFCLPLDQDDLDILASLADSDFEFEDDAAFGEAISSSDSPPKSTSLAARSQSQAQQQQHSEQSGTAPAFSVEEMAG